MIVQTIMRIMFIGVAVQAGKISFNTFLYSSPSKGWLNKLGRNELIGLKTDSLNHRFLDKGTASRFIRLMLVLIRWYDMFTIMMCIITRVLVGCKATLGHTVSQLVFVLLESKEQDLLKCCSIRCDNLCRIKWWRW